jgi:hypothetical protein
LFSLRSPIVGTQTIEACRREPWLLPQRLSLETPVIAIAWQLLFARVFEISVGETTLFLTGICVWIIYVTDHLLDSRRGLLYSSRHRFVARHARAFIAALTLSLVMAFGLSLRLPHRIYWGGIALSIVVGSYLFAIYRGQRIKRWLPKEVIVALLFAAGSAIVIWTEPHYLPNTTAALVSFVGLCLLNCAAVDSWEWQSVIERPHPPHGFVQWLGNHFAAAGLLLVAISALWLRHLPLLATAIIGSTMLLLLLERIRHHFRPESVRLLADAALLVVPLCLVVVR